MKLSLFNLLLLENANSYYQVGLGDKTQQLGEIQTSLLSNLFGV